MGRTGRAVALAATVLAGITLAGCGSAVPSTTPATSIASANATPGTAPSGRSPSTAATSGSSPSSTPNDARTGASASAVAHASDADDGSFGVVDAHSLTFVTVDRKKGATTGYVTLGIPGVGLAWSTRNVSLTKTPNGIIIRYDGAGRLAAHAEVDPVVGGMFGTLQTRSVNATLRVVGTVDPAAATGTVDIWVGGTHRRLTAAPVPHHAEHMAGQFVDATRSSDWHTIYRLAASDLRTHFSEAAFTAKAARIFSDGGRIEMVRITGPLTYRTLSTGVTYARVPLFMRAVIQGRTSSRHETLELVREAGAWRWWNTR